MLKGLDLHSHHGTCVLEVSCVSSYNDTPLAQPLSVSKLNLSAVRVLFWKMIRAQTSDIHALHILSALVAVSVPPPSSGAVHCGERGHLVR